MIVMEDGEFYIVASLAEEIESGSSFPTNVDLYHGILSQEGSLLGSQFIRYFDFASSEEGFGSLSVSHSKDFFNFEPVASIGVTLPGAPGYPPIPDSEFQMNYSISRSFLEAFPLERDIDRSILLGIPGISGDYSGLIQTSLGRLSASININSSGAISIVEIGGDCSLSGNLKPDIGAYRLKINSVSGECGDHVQEGTRGFIVKEDSFIIAVFLDSEERNPTILWIPFT